MVLVRGVAWMVAAVFVGLMGGVAGWQMLQDDLAVPELPSTPGGQAIRSASEPPEEGLAIVLTPIGVGADGVVVPRGGEVEVVVELRNPESVRYDQLSVTADLLDGRCRWPEESLATIWFLGARSSAERVCHLSLDGDDLGSLTVVAHNAGLEIGRARLVATVAAAETPPPIELDSTSTPLEAPLDEPGAEPMSPTCPLLRDGIESASSSAVADLGPLVTDRARQLDLGKCPDWSAVVAVDLVAEKAVGECTSWSVMMSGVAVGELRPAESERCDLESGPLYIDLNVDEVDTATAQQVTVLVAWAIAGDRASALAVAATLGRTKRGTCDDGAVLRARSPYLQDLSDGTTSYRTVVEAC
ncbi:MAG: hypothetical protein GY745_00345 [Actinomycetia bacterium]|nr:hypothetical protein [Actinomycetes bacterium]